MHMDGTLHMGTQQLRIPLVTEVFRTIRYHGNGDQTAWRDNIVRVIPDVMVVLL